MLSVGQVTVVLLYSHLSVDMLLLIARIMMSCLISGKVAVIVSKYAKNIQMCRI